MHHILYWLAGAYYCHMTTCIDSGYVLSPNRNIGCYNDHIGLKYDRNLGRDALKDVLGIVTKGVYTINSLVPADASILLK